MTATNEEVLAGHDDPGAAKGAKAYRALVALHGHAALCKAYALDEDSSWRDIVGQAYLHGDIDETGELT